MTIESIPKQIADLKKLSVAELRQRYAEVFGESTLARNKDWLVKRCAWRIQALDEGDLSDRARQRAFEIANDADLRTTAPKTLKLAVPVAMKPALATKAKITRADLTSDKRLPLPGTVITRDYKGRTLEVTVRADGFEFEGELYRSLSAVAKHVTGTHCNGFWFFRLGEHGGDR